MATFVATTFFRHQLPLRALMIEDQAWLCLHDLGRLMGVHFVERRIRSLDADQHREAWVQLDGEWGRHLLVSETGAVTLIMHSQMPENRALRQWLTLEVVPTLRRMGPGEVPAVTAMCAHGGQVKVLYWQDEPWIRLRDMPEVLPINRPHKAPWWRVWA
ncbi:Bro-N domain-containing protein [Pseudomonas sp. App30]|uniref:BRO-N domain-containing protein n=1 Tax=Pseudomonas sp. App30 TaxID=3068990 RepID=UPI003A80A9D2